MINDHMNHDIHKRHEGAALDMHLAFVSDVMLFSVRRLAFGGKKNWNVERVVHVKGGSRRILT